MRLFVFACVLGCGLGGCGPVDVPNVVIDAGTLVDAGPGRTDAGPDVVVDAGVDGDVDAGVVVPPACASLANIHRVFEQHCTRCHRPGGNSPDLTRAALPALVQSGLLVLNQPQDSYLYRKMMNLQGAGGGALMPLGKGQPLEDEAAEVLAWIEEGAPVTCDGTLPGEVLPAYDPNFLDTASLFSCDAQPSSSPTRLMRVGQVEWLHSIGYPRLREDANGPLENNPFLPSARLPYTTYTDDVSIDASTLSLYLLLLPDAGRAWTGRYARPTPEQEVPLSDASLRCMFNGVTTDDANFDECVDNYLDKYIAMGLFFRTPTPDERDQLRALLVQLIGMEGDVPAGERQERRRQTLQALGESAWLMVGALFRSEVGEGTTDEGRRPLSNDELASAVGRLLSTHPVGATLPNGTPAGHPDSTDVTSDARWFAAVRAAADDGSLRDPAVLNSLLDRYQSLVDRTRPDLLIEGTNVNLGALQATIVNRGEYALAQRSRDFFREYFDYEGANTTFKDTPRATTEWQSERPAGDMYDPITLALQELQQSYYADEPNLVQLMDDTIARTVIDAEQQDTNVLQALLTTTRWRVASNMVFFNEQTCAAANDCTDPVHPVCHQSGRCATNSVNSVAELNRIFHLPDVADTHEARWANMPAGERIGVLTHPAWLAAHGGAFQDDASMVSRGKWVREKLLCQTVPGLDLVAVQAQLATSDVHVSARERVRAATEPDPAASVDERNTCMGCHRLMNPLGQPFERYNHAGLLRGVARADGTGNVDSSTAFDGLEPSFLQGQSHADTEAFVTALVSSNDVKQCFVRHVFRYFAGRDETLRDRCTLTAMNDAFTQTGSFTELLKTFAASDAFLYRTDDAGVAP
jgi:hypothetical protein